MPDARARAVELLEKALCVGTDGEAAAAAAGVCPSPKDKKEEEEEVKEEKGARGLERPSTTTARDVATAVEEALRAKCSGSGGGGQYNDALRHLIYNRT